MKTKITFTITALILMFSVSTAFSQDNLLTNGDFELGDSSPWVIVDVTDGVGYGMLGHTPTAEQPSSAFMDDTDNNPDGPNGTGSWALSTTWGVPSGARTDWVLQQDITLAAGTYTFTWWAYSSPSILLRPHFHNLASQEDQYITNDFESWQEFSWTFTLEAETTAALGFRPWDSNGASGRWPAADITIVWDDFSLIAEAAASVEDQALNQAISYYPNPASDRISVQSKIALEKVEIFSVLGKLVKEVNTNFESISLEGLSSGNLYFLKIYSEEGGLAVRKLIKH